MTHRRTKTMDGNTAAAYVAYPFTDVAAIFPITPSSEMGEMTDAWSAEGKKNLFGRPVRVMEMQSEGGASGALHGILQGGGLATSFTASQGLLLMIPNMNRMAGELLPGVLHVASRGVGNSSFNIFAEHNDVMSTRSAGFAMLASRSPQDAMYLGAVAHLAAIKGSVPFLHFFDGFRTSHEMQKVSLLEYDELDKLLDHGAVAAFRARALAPRRPHAVSMSHNSDVYWQLRESANPYYEALPGIVSEYMQAINRLTGSSYDLFNYYGHPEAERVIVAMGSACSVLEEAVDAMNARGGKGGKVGLVAVHLFRPFVPERLRAVLPKSVKKIAVLDRSKEPGGAEPLYLDVCSGLCGSGKSEYIVVGGRFGVGGKEFTPALAQAAFENLALAEPRNQFTLGINDDVTNLSLPLPQNPIDYSQPGVTACKFWGLGSDGTVGANKSSVKIIGDHTDLHAQAYFAYDSKKSGGVTISHLRFGPSPIKSAYLVKSADFVACHNPAYVRKYDMVQELRPGGTFLLNCNWSDEELDAQLPGAMKRYIAENRIKLHTLNAVDTAIELGIPGRINMIMQSAFFALAKIIPLDEAMSYLRDSVRDAYGKQGEAIVGKNLEALERGVAALHEVKVPESWKTAPDDAPADNSNKPEFYRSVVQTILDQKGDSLPVSAFKDRASGQWPFGISAYEKRGIAVHTAKWLPENCIQCNQCAFVCPHACVRPRLLTDAEVAAAPAGLTTLPAAGSQGLNFHLAVSPLDCTGCGQCAWACPAKEKALAMTRLTEQLPQGAELWNYTEKLPYRQPEGKLNVKNSQFKQPLLEFSGACAGCGETPYVKLLTQLFGDRMTIGNSAGCSVVWACGSPSVAYTANQAGRGPAWGYSLFEDTAEYGLGIHLAVEQLRDTLAGKVEQALAGDYSGELKENLQAWLTGKALTEGTVERAERAIAAVEAARNKNEQDALLRSIFELRDYFDKRSVWIFGGDGWAYDIGYGGLDHTLAQGLDVNVLVMDTEVYSNTGGQASKATPLGAIAPFAVGGKGTGKKNLGLMCMTYENIYVAQVSMGADKAQCLKAFQEAEAYPGPSIVLAYAPCINHGIKGGLANGLAQAKEAAEVGYWPLYRYNPLLAARGENPFQLDSKPPHGDFEAHLLREVRYASLKSQNPEKAAALFARAEAGIRQRYDRLASLAGLPGAK